uniref:DUF4283 domain-containing protein n=1 Tax=Tanacetum cinerariifolium TaxID=118510 RepID=A0A699KJ96_TANCI|nr:hypothetical protein CTI12_AA215700 [Tanacetum cinerariifolium]
MRKGAEDRELQMKFVPRFVSNQSNGTNRIAISAKDIKNESEACALHLYGYFVGTSMDYRVVNANVSRMWRVYGIAEITKTSSGLFYFKFKNEEGMKAILESGPWMINYVTLVLNVWEHGIWLEKVEPSTILIWVCVYGISMELCNGNGIGKIMSGIGKPMLMVKLTKERCLKKAGKLDFARVLVEVSATDVLPETLEIKYPSIGDRPGRDALKVNKSGTDMDSDVKADNDGFVVGKKNKLWECRVILSKIAINIRMLVILLKIDGFKVMVDHMLSKGYGGSVGSLQKGNLKSVNEVVLAHKKVDNKNDEKSDVVLKPPLNF